MGRAMDSPSSQPNDGRRGKPAQGAPPREASRPAGFAPPVAGPPVTAVPTPTLDGSADGARGSQDTKSERQRAAQGSPSDRPAAALETPEGSPSDRPAAALETPEGSFSGARPKAASSARRYAMSAANCSTGGSGARATSVMFSVSGTPAPNSWRRPVRHASVVE